MSVRRFNDIFLDRKSMSDFETLINSPISKSEKGYGFSTPIKKSDTGIAYLELPLEVIQSIVLHLSEKK